jgi:hypothetical protein
LIKRCYGATRRTIGDAGKSKLTGRDEKNPVFGLDISKEESHGQAFFIATLSLIRSSQIG